LGLTRFPRVNKDPCEHSSNDVLNQSAYGSARAAQCSTGRHKDRAASVPRSLDIQFTPSSRLPKTLPGVVRNPSSIESRRSRCGSKLVGADELELEVVQRLDAPHCTQVPIAKRGQRSVDMQIREIDSRNRREL
jgi:hypothetical protein